MTTVTITVPYDRPPLTANQRMHYMQRARLTKALRDGANLSIKAALTPEQRATWPLPWVRVQLVWNVTDRRRRDEDNIVPTLKPICDGLVDAGIVPDDTPEYMQKAMPLIVLREKGDPNLVPVQVIITS